MHTHHHDHTHEHASDVAQDGDVTPHEDDADAGFYSRSRPILFAGRSGTTIIRALRHEQRQVRDRPVGVAVLSDRPLFDLAAHGGASRLYRDLAGDEAIVARDAGFGREVSAAQAARRQWL